TNITINRNMTIQGQSQTGTIINGTGTNWIFNITSGVNVTLLDLTLTNASHNRGGAIYNQGDLTIINCTFTNNTATDVCGVILNEVGNCTVTNSTFTGNKAIGNCGVIGSIGGIFTVTNCTFINNEAVVGGVIINEGAIFTVTGCNFMGNTATYGSVIANELTTLEAHFNRFYNNTATTGIAIYLASGSVNATLNWWGSNDDPSSQIYGNVDYSPWLFMTINATPETINNTQTSLITVSLNNYSFDGSSSSPLDPNLGHISDGVPVTFSLIDGPLGTLGSQTGFINGTASIIFTANAVGVQHVNATIDNENRTATITINPIGHVNITKTADNYTPNYWDGVTFTITAGNEGPDDVEGLEITDILPNGLTLISADTHGFGSYNSGIWNIGTLTNGTTAILTLFVNATSTGTFTNWANVTAQATYDLKPWSQDNAIITVPSAADIAVEKAFYDYEGDYEITSANYWDIISTRILVTNNGPATATNVVISDILGSGLSFVDEWWVKWDINDLYWNLNDASFDPATMTWTIPSLLAGQTAVLDIMTNLTSTGTLHNYAELVSSETYDWNHTNNNDTAYLTVPEASYLSIYKEFRDLPWGNVITTAYYNDMIYAIVQVKNQGPDTTSVSILDTMTGIVWTGNYYVLSNVGSILPTPSSWVLNDPVNTFNGTNWNIPFLNIFIGSEKWLAIEGIINQTGINAASNHAETVDQNTYPYKGYANYTANLTTLAAPTSITVGDVRGNKGDTVTLSATLTDHNSDPVVGATVEFWVDGAKVGESNTGSDGTAIFNYPITETPGNHILQVVFNGNTFYQGSNATGNLYVPSANLYIVITSDKNNPTVGEIFTLRYKLGNNGPDTADNVTITIPLPEGFVISKIEGDGNWTVTGNTITWTMKNVTVGDPNLYVSGWTTGPGNYLFTASITSDTFNINSMGISPLTLNTQPTVNAATTTNTVGMQTTGTPVVPLALAVLGVLCGLVATRKNQ
ncbi:MAG: repeat-containing protein, partial [Methanobacterium sp. Maddingley MBC34]